MIYKQHGIQLERPKKKSGGDDKFGKRLETQNVDALATKTSNTLEGREGERELLKQTRICKEGKSARNKIQLYNTPPVSLYI